MIGVLAAVAARGADRGLSASLDDGVGWCVGVVLACSCARACAFVAALVYAPWMMARTNGRTLGRMAFGIRVVRVDGAPMDFKRAFLREVGDQVGAVLRPRRRCSRSGILPLVDVLWPLWDEQNRALHDLLARTARVRG